MPPAAMAAVAIGGALYSAQAQRRQQQAQNRLLEGAAGQMSSGQILKRLSKLNPQLYAAAYGGGRFNSFGQPGNFGEWLDQQSQMSQLAQQNPLAALFQAPGTIDPRAMNFAFEQNEMLGQSAQQQTARMLGKANYSGGLAAAATLANQASKNAGASGIFRDFLQQREQLRRSDIELGQGILSNNINQASGQASTSAGILAQRGAPMGNGAIAGQAIGAGLQAYGAFKSLAQSNTSQPFSNNSFTQTPGRSLNMGGGDGFFKVKPLT